MTDFEKIYSFESLYNAYRKARQGKRWKGAAAKFEVNLLEALNLLSAQIRTKSYTMSPYNTFEVYEPKRRVVMSNSYKDKVVQHSLCDNVLEPILTRSFIRDNYASQVGKGTHYGLDRLQEFIAKHHNGAFRLFTRTPKPSRKPDIFFNVFVKLTNIRANPPS